MIGKLKGIIDSYGEDHIVVDVNGVGYVVHCSARTLQALPAQGEPVALAIETHVREDQIRLFGFLSDIEREWFRLLQTVQGVGTKVALSILSTLRPRLRCVTRRWWRARPASARRSPSASSRS
jgi:holliday junction DNA helicase RuvA